MAKSHFNLFYLYSNIRKSIISILCIITMFFSMLSSVVTKPIIVKAEKSENKINNSSVSNSNNDIDEQSLGDDYKEIDYVESDRYISEWVDCSDKVIGNKLYIDNIEEYLNYKTIIKDQFDNVVEVHYDIHIKEDAGGGYASGAASGGSSSGLGEDSTTGGSTSPVDTPTDSGYKVTFHSDKGYINGEKDTTELIITTRGDKKLFSGNGPNELSYLHYPDYINIFYDGGSYKGYVFKGWKKTGDDALYKFIVNTAYTDAAVFIFPIDNSLDNEKNLYDYIVTEDTTFEAVWEYEELCHVTFKADEQNTDFAVCKQNEKLWNYPEIRNTDKEVKGLMVEGDDTLYVIHDNDLKENEKFIGDYVVTEPVTFEVVWKESDADEDETIDICTNHKWNSGVVTKVATATEDGIKTYTCDVCHTTKTEVIAKTGIVTEGNKDSDKKEPNTAYQQSDSQQTSVQQPEKQTDNLTTFNIKNKKTYAKSKKIIIKDSDGIKSVSLNGKKIKSGKKKVSFKLSKYKKYLKKKTKWNKLVVVDVNGNVTKIQFKMK